MSYKDDIDGRDRLEGHGPHGTAAWRIDQRASAMETKDTDTVPNSLLHHYLQNIPFESPSNMESYRRGLDNTTDRQLGSGLAERCQS